MNTIYAKARAKINLSLEVLDKRADNYHNIQSVFQRISLYDTISITKMDHDDFELETNVEKINNKQNIIYKAYVALKEKFSNITGIKVVLDKTIPMQAGLGGGSADCACFLISMNQLFELGMSLEELAQIGKTLGADVVPCLYDGAMVAEGIGEIITEIESNRAIDMVLIKPEISCDTKQMYQRIDETSGVKKNYSLEELKEGLKLGSLDKIAKNLYNDFEEAIPDRSLIESIKKEFLENGAAASMMTGSGSCVFGLFETKELAEKAYQQLKTKYETYICTFYNTNQED